MLLFVLSVIAFFTTQSQAWIVLTHPTEIVPGSTKNVQLICTQDEASKNGLGTLNRIRITKIDAFCSKTTFAEVLVARNRTYKEDKDVVITSNIGLEQLVFLKVTWPTATKDTAGAYGCEIEGYTQADNFKVIKIGPKLIKEKVLTQNDIDILISSATAELKKKQRVLESEIVDLKKLLKDSIESIKQLRRADIGNSRTEMSDLRQEIKAEYITKDELAVTATSLMNSTTEELRKFKLDQESELKESIDLIRNSVSDVKRTILSRLETESNECCSKLTITIGSLEVNYNQSLNECNEELSRLTNLVTLVDKKYGNITKDLRKVVMNKNTLCPAVTTSVRPTTQGSLPTSTSTKMITSTTTTSTSSLMPCNKRQWPSSPFSLVKPVSGCAESSKMATISKTIPNSAFYFATDSKQANISRLLNIKVQHRSSKRQLEFCSKEESLPGTARVVWPKGSYCIIQEEKCSEQFQSGQMHYFIGRESKDLGFFMFPFCCRNDGPAESPIYLPCEKSFVLYRYNGVCQTVAGMDLTTAYVTVDEMDDIKVSVYSSDHSPDKNPIRKIVYLCHYRRSTEV